MVVERALALGDAEGVEALTIRRLAAELGVTPMALYWHFRNKEELLAALGDQVWSELDTDVDLAVPWYLQMRGLLESLLHVLRAHPCASQLILRARSRATPRWSPRRPRWRCCAAAASTRSTPPRSPAAPCGPGSCW